MRLAVAERFILATNVVHYIVMVVLVAGPLVAHPRYLLALMGSSMVFLFRYHDYCFLSEMTRIIKMLTFGCEDPRNFTDEVADFYKNQLGLPMGDEVDKEMFSISATSLVMLSFIVGAVRFSRYFGVPIVPNNLTFALVVAFILTWVTTEVALVLVEPRPFCQAADASARAN